MDIEFLKTFGQIAGIGGLALVTFLILFRDIIRKKIFPTLKKDDAYRLLRLIVILISTITVIGIGAWVWSENNSKIVVNVEANRGWRLEVIFLGIKSLSTALVETQEKIPNSKGF